MGRALVLWAGVLLFGRAAWADTPRPAAPEHELVVEERGERPPPRVDEGLIPTPEWDWPRLHLEEGRAFADPFLGVELFPEISVGTSLAVARLAGVGQVAHQTSLDLNLYVLELKAWLSSGLDGRASPPRIEAALKVPFAWPGAPSHRLALVWGALVQDAGPALSNSSRGELLYGWGASGFSLQARAGYGFEQLFADQPLRQGLLWGALVGLRLGAFEPILQADGFRAVLSRDDRVALLAGLRLHPGGENLQVGAAVLLVRVRGEQNPGNRAGAVLDLGYNFL